MGRHHGPQPQRPKFIGLEETCVRLGPSSPVTLSMSDRTARWVQDFQRARSSAAQIKAELQRIDLLKEKQSAGELSKQKQKIRGEVMNLKGQLDRLSKELDGLSAENQEHEVTRKQLTQYRDDLNLAMAELPNLMKSAKGENAATPRLGADPPGSNGSFAQLAGEPSRGPPSGAELQPVQSHRSMLDHQKAMLRDLEQPLNVLDSHMDNLAQISTAIGREISHQNDVLDETNVMTDRVHERLSRTRALLNAFADADQNPRLLAAVFILLGALIVIFCLVVI